MKIQHFKYLALAAIVLVASDAALAATAAATPSGALSPDQISDIAYTITTSLRGVAAVVTAVCYVIAFIFGCIGLWQLNAHDKKPTKTSYRAPIIYLTIAVLFGGFPEFLGSDTNCGVWGCGPHDNWTPNSQIMGQSPIIGEAPRVQTHVIQD